VRSRLLRLVVAKNKILSKKLRVVFLAIEFFVASIEFRIPSLLFCVNVFMNTCGYNVQTYLYLRTVVGISQVSFRGVELFGGDPIYASQFYSAFNGWCAWQSSMYIRSCGTGARFKLRKLARISC